MCKAFAVFYNAVRTEHGAHLVALGWCDEDGWTPVLDRIHQTDDCRLSFEKGEGDIRPQVITPFAVTAVIGDGPRSIIVRDDHGDHQVQVNGIRPVGSGGNTPGEWVESA